MDPREFRNAMGTFATGVTVISVYHDGKAHGMTANAFSSVSLEPPLVLVCIDHRANSLGYIREAGHFGVNVLSSEQEDVSRLFAHQKLDKTPEIRFSETEGAPLLEGALVQCNCKVVQTVEAGDHTIFIGEVGEIRRTEGEPLCFYQGKYRALAQ
ncbi:flavin reductase family protein [Paenibacillaceae bacterium WGS1546]|uniref:flavin reductase family protein n=1 Tax=Cohnella sp. WGS1546 TaxID=3366810 RepID=UPI00372D853D